MTLHECILNVRLELVEVSGNMRELGLHVKVSCSFVRAHLAHLFFGLVNPVKDVLIDFDHELFNALLLGCSTTQ